MKFVHVFDERLKNVLENQGFRLLQSYKVNEMTVWVFDNSKGICDYVKYSTDRKEFFLSDKLYF
jgi:hypothetical protein